VSKQAHSYARNEDVDSRQQAISDCKYAKSLGNTALMQHIMIWGEWDGVTLRPGGLYADEEYDLEYYKTIFEVADKLGTPECILEN
jgi:hypothetical protein